MSLFCTFRQDKQEAETRKHDAVCMNNPALRSRVVNGYGFRVQGSGFRVKRSSASRAL